MGKILIISQANEANENSTSVDIDTQIQLVCNHNATLIGNPLATCMEDGNNKLNQNQMAVTSFIPYRNVG